ncbi:hypothetical protein AJ79_09658 [Helicocarpus griseus UAMH5409]|uniref:Uncharacterized protein n=1 Tax=Helicocarpus griseus UAMH5409 TaxID=1447875 RepID=A0A2B7WI76_9EURO|nr:hypothetical protein AJ79_09658 [Helicocarpus griseus UAMH5409]
MAPPAKRQKPNASHDHYDLTEAMSSYPDFFRALNTILKDGLSEDKVPVLWPFLQSIASAVSHIPSSALGPSYQPSKLTLQQVTEKLDIDFNERKREYMWALTEDQLKQSARKPLSSWAATAIEKVADSPALSNFRREASIRTLFDILLADRLDQLDDSGANNKLCVGYEVPMTATVKQERGGGTISGKADWSLGYMVDTTRLEQMLVVIEAKSAVQADNMAQILAYLFAVQDARVKSKKASTAVFGVLTDFADFRFVVLRETGKAMQSESLSWAMRSDQVVAFLDSILLDAIKSSPHTTPQKMANSTIKHFDDHLKMTYDIHGEESAASGGEDEDVTFDVIEVDGVSVLISHQANRSDDSRSSLKPIDC